MLGLELLARLVAHLETLAVLLEDHFAGDGIGA